MTGTNRATNFENPWRWWQGCFRGMATWSLLMALSAALVFVGCKGSSPPAEGDGEAAASAGGEKGDAGGKAAALPSDQAAAKKPGKKEKPATKEKLPQKPPQETVVFDAPEKVVAPRPDSVVEWTHEHFLSAKRDRDPRLLDAVAYLGEHFAGDVDVVPLLADLLVTAEDPVPEPEPEPEPEKKPAKKTSSSRGGYDEMMMGMEGMDEGDEEQEEEGYGMMEDMEGFGGEEADEEEEYPEEYGGMIRGPGGRRQGPGAGRSARVVPTLTPSYVSLTGGIVAALGGNGTDASRAVLRQLLAGKLETGDDQVATSAALKALGDNPSLENEAILFKTLTAPETFRPPSALQEPAPGEGETAESGGSAKKPETVTAEILRATTLPLIKQAASMRLRVELVKYLLGPSPAAELRQQLEQLTVASDPYNLAAQIGLYGRQETGGPLKEKFELFFTTYSASALGRILGVSTQEPPELPPLADLAGVGQTDTAGAKRPWVAFGNNPPPSDVSGGRPPGRPGFDYQPEDSDDETDDLDMEMDEEMYGEMGPEMGGEEEDIDDAMEGYEEMDAGFGGRGGPLGGSDRGPARKEVEAQPADMASAKAFRDRADGDAKLPYELVETLWNTRLLTEVANRLRGLSSLAESAQLVSLASTVPNDAMRSVLYNTLKAHWQEGPLALNSAAEFPELGIKDPGYLAVIKSLPRQEPPVKRPSARRSERSERSARASQEEAPKPEYEWMTASREVVQEMCKRFDAAAENESDKFSEVLQSLPFKLHPEANPTAAYHADWLGRIGDKVAGVRLDAMQVYYVRIEEAGKYGTRLGFYRRELKLTESRPFDGGTWLDGFRPGTQPGRKQSVDVLINRPEFDPERSTREDEPLVIEILLVEVNDPVTE